MTGDLRLWVINLILAAGVLVISLKVWSVWETPLPEIRVPEAVKFSQNDNRISLMKSNRMKPIRTYEIIPQRNVFADSRNEYEPAPAPEEAEPEVNEKVKISGKRVHLYGVILQGKKRLAFVSDPEKRKTGKNTLIVSEQDEIGGLRVTRILPDKIVLKGGGEIYEISLYSKDKPVPRVSSPDKPEAPRVVAAGQPVKPSGPGKPESKTTEKSGTQSGDEPKYEIIDTPFGKIKRRIK